MPQLQDALRNEMCEGTGQEEGERVSRKFVSILHIVAGKDSVSLYHNCRQTLSHIFTIVEAADFPWRKSSILRPV